MGGPRNDDAQENNRVAISVAVGRQCGNQRDEFVVASWAQITSGVAQGGEARLRGETGDHAGLLCFVEIRQVHLNFKLVGDPRPVSVVSEVLFSQPTARAGAGLRLEHGA